MPHILPTEGRAFLNRPHNDDVTTVRQTASKGSIRRFCDSFSPGLIFSTMAATIVILLLLSMYAEFLSPRVLAQEPELPKTERRTQLIKFGIIPDVINDVPEYLLEVVYGNLYIIYFGNKVDPDYLAPPPHTVTWPSEEHKRYSLAMIDPDHPSRMHPTEREFLHWLVVNIPDDNIMGGQDVAEYYAPEPEPGSGPHRFIFVLWEQPKGKIDSKEPYSDVYVDKHRKKFSCRKFAEKYGFGDPIAINFFIGEKFLRNLTTTTTKKPIRVPGD